MCSLHLEETFVAQKASLQSGNGLLFLWNFCPSGKDTIVTCNLVGGSTLSLILTCVLIFCIANPFSVKPYFQFFFGYMN